MKQCKHHFKLFFQIITVVMIVSSASLALSRQNDVRLENVEFVSVESADRSADQSDLVEAKNPTKDESIVTAGKITPIPSAEPVVTKQITDAPLYGQITDLSVLDKTITIRLAGGGIKGDYAVVVAGEETVHRLMQRASEQYNFSYGTKGFSGLGVFVDEIAGVRSDEQAGMYWIYSVNGTKATVGVSSREVQAGDVILWTYEKAYQ